MGEETLRAVVLVDMDQDYPEPRVAEALATAQYALRQWSALTARETNAQEIDDENDDEVEREGGGQNPGKNKMSRSLLLCTMFSVQYAKMVIVLGLVLPISEVLVPSIVTNSFEGFYLYLYMGSLLFMMYMYIAAAWRRRVRVTVKKCKSTRGIRCRLKRMKREQAEESVRYGSLYLRLGANAFGIGSMVYCGLEISHELERLFRGPMCPDDQEAPVRILLPACRAALTLLQMHFMLFNDKGSQVKKSPCVARVGLAHMIATNVCEWLSIVVEETRHEIAELGSGGWILADRDDLGGLAGNWSLDVNSTAGVTCTPSAGGDIIRNLVQSSGPFLFPCIVEYSLICAVILFEMWKHTGVWEESGSASTSGSRMNLDSNGSRSSRTPDDEKNPALSVVTGSSSVPWRTAHHLSVDLTHSQRGLFLGLVLVVATIMSLVLFFALGESPALQRTAHAVISYLELSLHAILFLAVGLAAFSMRRLGASSAPYYPLPLDIFLLLVAQTGAYLYSVFSLIGAYLMLYQEDSTDRLFSSVIRCLAVEGLSTLHVCAQTHFIFRAWHLRCVGEQQWSDKPGRQHITFLMFGNLCLWLVATFCKSRAQFRPLHMQLFGVWPWTVLTHVSMPLTIFFHFHSSICLFEIWKNSYKFRPD